jgi:catechol 2,3-dioxygenase-like lactoylglutathione lyase family enzyme
MGPWSQARTRDGQTLRWMGRCLRRARPDTDAVCHHADMSSGPVESINAVTLAVSDMADSVSFYAALGFEVAFGGPTSTFTSLQAGPGFLNLQLDPAHAPVPAIWGRVILWVDDVDAMHARVLAAGARPSNPSDAPWGERYFHVCDPDGHELSFARPLKGAPDGR